MKKALMIFPIVLSFAIPSAAQITKIILGPRDGDNAGILQTYHNATVEVDLWIRTDPSLCGITGLHLPLSSRNDLIQSNSRSGGRLFHPFQYWDDISFLAPNDDTQHQGYTSQSLLGICTVLGYPCDHYRLIDTDGEWWKIASFLMTAASCIDCDELYCDALIEGYEPLYNWGIVLVDNCSGELDPSEYEVEFACLQFDQSCGDYEIGDFNGSGAFNVADVVIAVHKLLGASLEFTPCEYCPPEGWEP